MMPTSFSAALLALVALAHCAYAAPAAPAPATQTVAAAKSAPETVDYLRDIKPILSARCFSCHSALRQKANLRLDASQLIRQGGDSGPAFKPGQSAESLLLHAVTGTRKATPMPPKSEGEPLTEKQIALLAAWIDQGAVAPVEKIPEDPRQHWAFVAPVRPAVPVVKNAAWVRNPIDAFLAREHEQRGLQPLPAAEPAVLLRRIYLDLIGLPPTLAELAAFQQDTSPQAYERVVDQLLERPQYGERWGRHWMDVWRYSDWHGLGAQLRYSQKHIWHWRDWIIESLNKDKPYDRMIREMLAGDELAPTDPDVLRATGFLARQYFLFNRNTWMENAVEHTSKAFLGMTMNCTRCHDHKYDPIAQTEYFHFRAFFEPYQVRLDAVPGETNLERDGLPRAFDLRPDAPTHLFIRGDDRYPDKTKTYEPRLPGFLAFKTLRVTPVTLPLTAYAPSLRPEIKRDLLAVAETNLTKARATLETARKTLATAAPDESPAESPTTPTPAIPPTPAKPAPAPTKPTAAPVPAKPLVHDTFAAPNPTLWTLGPGDWKYDSGKLLQKQTGDTRASLRLNQTLPADFEARVRFRITGGNRHRSVGLTFDTAADHEKLIYLSAGSAGKLQIAYKSGGPHRYPADAAQPRTVPLNEPIDLAVFVRGRVLNVSINGQPALTHRLPIDRRAGHFELITFDASAAFESLTISPLSDDLLLDEPAETKPAAPVAAATPAIPKKTTASSARAAVDLAEKTLRTAEARVKMINATFAADEARYSQPPAANAAALATAAAVADKQHALARAEEELLRAEQEFAGELAATPAPKTKTKAKAPATPTKKVTDAKAALDKARQAAAAPGNTYASLRTSRKAFEGPTETDAMLPAVFPGTSTGRRTALADWIADRQNPLTARVAVNHLWARHFGEPLVKDVTDFGRKNAPPQLPALLDWLAVEFMESGWSFKHLHRLMLNSSAYRLSGSLAGVAPAARAADPDNRYFWRRNPVRMESQIVRDSILALAGTLDLTLGGPTVDPRKDEASPRRSLYFTHSQEDIHRFLDLFDNANPTDCYRRAESIVPQQALALSNSKLVLTLAPKIVECLEKTAAPSDDAHFIRLAYQTILGLPPTPDEQRECEQALTQLKKLSPTRARVTLVQTLLNHNDFITIR